MEHNDAPAGTRWHRLDSLPDEGRVIPAVVDGRSVALTRCGAVSYTHLTLPTTF